MSGERRTTVTIDQELYRRLSVSDEQLRAMRHDLPELLRNVGQQTAADLTQRLRPLEERQQHFERAVSNLQGEVRDFQRETAAQLSRQQQQFREAVEQVRGEVQSLARQTAQRFDQQRREFDQKLQQQRRELVQQIQAVEQRVSDIEAREQHRRDLAQVWLEGAVVAYDQVAANKRHEEFTPGRLEEQARTIRQARVNLNQGAAEAALAQAQDATQQLADLLLELQQKEQEWMLWQSAALASAKALLGLAQRNRQVSVYDLDGKKLAKAIDTDYWTKGLLTRLEQEIDALITKAQDEEIPLSTRELRQLAEQEIPELDQQLDSIIQQARAEVLGAQMRINIADLVVQALEEQGFEVEGGAYQGKDMRAGYVAKTMHLDGGEVAVCVTPVEGHPGHNNLHINSYDAEQLAPAELQARQEEVFQVLRESGLEVGDGICLPPPDEAVRDLEQVEAMPVVVKPLVETPIAAPVAARPKDRTADTQSRWHPGQQSGPVRQQRLS